MAGHDFSFDRELLDAGTLRFRPLLGGGPASWRRVLDLWRDHASFRETFTATLAGVPFRAFRWETPALDAGRLDRPFEWVVVDDPSIDIAPDPSAFAAHFDKERAVVSFDNLGSDARLIAPCPQAEPSAYTHIGAFVRQAPSRQHHALWRETALAVGRCLGERPVWLSTAGGGVAWLHVRLDRQPKYYAHAPYRRHPD